MESSKNSIIFSPEQILLLSLGYLLSFAIAELLIYFQFPVWSIVLYFIILFSLITIGALAGDQSQRGLWLALGLAPLIRIVSIVMPVMLEISRYLWYIIISIPVIISVIAASRVLEFNFDDIGLNVKKPLFQVLIGASGAFLSVIDYFILKPQAWTNRLAFQTTLFPALVLLIFTGLIEELVFRGVIQHAAELLGSYEWVYVAAVYAVLQLGQGSILHCVFAFAMGLLFGWIVKKTGSITGVGISHGLINIGLYLVLPYIK